jgi:glycosyltransferase involved in cell wall biosynthesis
MSVDATESADLPLVSIGIASFNNGRYITQLLDSIRYQSYSPIELLVVDDCSTDDSVDIIKGWMDATNFPLKLIRHSENKGLIAVIAELRHQALGRYVLWLGSDDWLLPHMVANTLKEFERRGPQCGVVYSDCLVVDAAGKEINSSFIHYFNAHFGTPYPEGNVRVPLLSGFYLPTPTTMVRRSALDQIGPYDLNLSSEDLDTWLRISVKWTFAYLPEVTAAYRVHNQSVSNSHKPQLSETYFRIYQKTTFAPGAELESANKMLAEHAEHYYASQHRAAASYLWRAYRKTSSIKMLVFCMAALLGISHRQLKSVISRGK